MIWAFFLTFSAGLALTYASLEYISSAQLRRRKAFVQCGIAVSAAFALGFAVDFQALMSSQPIYEAPQHAYNALFPRPDNMPAASKS
jgi:hypothetical protein